VGEHAAGDHEGDTGDTAEVGGEAFDFGGDGLWCADEEGSGGSALGVEGGAGGGSPAAFAADAGEGVLIGGPELVGGLVVGVGEVADAVEGDVEFGAVVSSAFGGLVVEVDERTEAVGFTADDSDGEREAEGSSAGEGCGCAADA